METPLQSLLNPQPPVFPTALHSSMCCTTAHNSLSAHYPPCHALHPEVKTIVLIGMRVHNRLHKIQFPTL